MGHKEEKETSETDFLFVILTITRLLIMFYGHNKWKGIVFMSFIITKFTATKCEKNDEKS